MTKQQAGEATRELYDLLPESFHQNIRVLLCIAGGTILFLYGVSKARKGLSAYRLAQNPAGAPPKTGLAALGIAELPDASRGGAAAGSASSALFDVLAGALIAGFGLLVFLLPFLFQL